MTAYVVGRDADNAQIVVPSSHQSVSRIHARITAREDGNYDIEDLNSSGGTFVMRSSVWERVRAASVRPDERIRLATFETTVEGLLAARADQRRKAKAQRRAEREAGAEAAAMRSREAGSAMSGEVAAAPAMPVAPVAPMPRTASARPQVAMGSIRPEAHACWWAMIAHAISVPLSALGPIAVWMWKGPEHPFVDTAAKEAINFQVTIILCLLIALLSMLLVVGYYLVPLVLAAHVGLPAYAAYRTYKATTSAIPPSSA
jgi:hypothetical protein